MILRTLSLFSLVLVLCSHSYALADLHEECQNALSPQKVEITHRGQPANELLFQENVQEDGKTSQQNKPGSQLDFGQATVKSIRLSDGAFNPVFAGTNIQTEMADWVTAYINHWRDGLFDGRDALHYLSFEELVLMKKAKTEADATTTLQEIFLKRNKILNPVTGLFATASDPQPKYGVQFFLTPDGALRKIDLGDLPRGIYKLVIQQIDNGNPKYRQFFFVINP